MSSILREMGTKSGRLSMSMMTMHFRICRSLSTTTVWAAPTAAAQQKTGLRPVSEVPGPFNVPILGTTLSMLFDKDFDVKRLHKYWQAKQQEYGPIYRASLLGFPNMVMVTDPDHCEKINRASVENPERPPMGSLKRLREKAQDNYFEGKSGIINENGEEWWRVRSRVQTPMMKMKNLEPYIAKMDEVALDFMERISELQTKYGEMPSDFQAELYKWGLETVGLVALSRRLGCLDPDISKSSEPVRFIQCVQDMFDSLNDLEFGNPIWRIYPTAAYRKLMASHTEFLKIADQNIRQTEAMLLERGPPTDEDDRELQLMERLLLTPGLSRKDVITLILDMLFAGIDTTSHTLGFALYLLARNPEKQALLQKEVDRVLKGHEGPLTAKHLAQFTYMKSVIRESLRIFPLTIGMGRTLTHDIELSGYLIPKGHFVAMMNMLMGWDESLFPRVKEFIPERWQRDRPLGPIHPFASLPFGAGARMCIGRRIAEQELYIFLARAMQRYTVDYKYQDMDIVTRLVFVPSEPLKFTFTERR